jgi:hypothetical protein
MGDYSLTSFELKWDDRAIKRKNKRTFCRSKQRILVSFGEKKKPDAVPAPATVSDNDVAPVEPVPATNVVS